MNPFGAILGDKIKPWWSSLDSGAKFQITAVTLAAVAAAIIMAVFLLRPSYETLYAGLDPAEAGQVVEKLKADKVPYRIDNGGTTIEVSRKNIYDIRLQMASEGLPRSGTVGYEIFDKTNLGMTDFLQKVNFRRALEGEIAKSICTIREVKSARVHIVIPENRLFQEDQKHATASVILNVYGAQSISARQVEGIAYLVSSSVEGLSPENVTILDTSGKLLTKKNYGDGAAALSSTQMDLQRNVESYLESKARSVLDPVIGEGKSAVTVSAQLNFEQVEKTMENYDPDNLAIRSEERNTEKSSEANAKTDGPGKTTSNSTENTVTNYEVNKTVQHVVSQMGNITKLWVAVVVDGNYKTIMGDGGKETQQYTPRTQEELDKIASVVKGAVGFDDQRNDDLEIANVPFENKPEPEEKQGFFTGIQVNNYTDYIWKGLLILAALFIFMRMKKKFGAFLEKQKIQSEEIAKKKEQSRGQNEMIPRLNGEPQLIDHLRAIANERPNEIARVVKTMMVEE
jgi:flagellar M-ring protein FliF